MKGKMVRWKLTSTILAHFSLLHSQVHARWGNKMGDKIVDMWSSKPGKKNCPHVFNWSVIKALVFAKFSFY